MSLRIWHVSSATLKSLPNNASMRRLHVCNWKFLVSVWWVLYYAKLEQDFAFWKLSFLTFSPMSARRRHENSKTWSRLLLNSFFQKYPLKIQPMCLSMFFSRLLHWLLALMSFQVWWNFCASTKVVINFQIFPEWSKSSMSSAIAQLYHETHNS